MKTAAIYARYSPGRDRDQSSTIEAQIAMCREKAASDGLCIDEQHIYIDRHISAATSTPRKAFQALLSAIEAGRCPPVLIVKDDKRLFRNEREAGELIEWIWAQGIEIRYCLVQFGDPRSSDEEWFLQRSFHLFAELERRRKTREVFEHQRQNTLAGFSNGGLPPYGYARKEIEIVDEVGIKKKKLTWEIDPMTAPAVRLAYELHERGLGIKEVAAELTRRGYRSRRGGSMNKLTVAEWFRNPFVHAGCMVWNTRDHRLRSKPKAEWIIVEGAYPGIISWDMANRTYEKAKERREKVGKMKTTKGGKYLLSGMLKCSDCGRNFIASGAPSRGDVFYICGSRSRRKDGCTNKLMLHQREADHQVSKWLKETMTHTSFLEEYFQRVLTSRTIQESNSQEQIKTIKRQLGQVERRIARLIDMAADGTMPQDILKQKIHTEMDTKRHLMTEFKAYQTNQPPLPNLSQFRDTLILMLDEEETKKVALRGLVNQIIVHPDATLRIECSIQTCFLSDSATPHHPESRLASHWFNFPFIPPPRGGFRPRPPTDIHP